MVTVQKKNINMRMYRLVLTLLGVVFVVCCFLLMESRMATDIVKSASNKGDIYKDDLYRIEKAAEMERQRHDQELRKNQEEQLLQMQEQQNRQIDTIAELTNQIEALKQTVKDITESSSSSSTTTSIQLRSPANISETSSFAPAVQQQQQQQQQQQPSSQSPPDFILGLSTGHAGSTTYHNVMHQSSDHCPWDKPKGKFELTYKGEDKLQYEKQQRYDPNVGCTYTKQVLIPFLEEQRGNNSNSIYIDLGHFHNRLPNGLECLAEELGDRLAYIQIRRNRYDIARSFEPFGNPCHDYPKGKHKHPIVSYCPHSNEAHGPTYFPVNNPVWDLLKPFQKFLWLADEMELRSQRIKEMYPKVRFYETTWTTGEEFMAGINDVKQSLGCNVESRKGEVRNDKKHVSHEAGSRHCTEYVLDDLDYRQKTGMTQEQTKRILPNPQRVGGVECMETREALEQVLLSAGEQLDDWDITPDPPPAVPSHQTSPDFILGLSTGHAGSTTYHGVMHKATKEQQCPWNEAKGKFESTAPEEKTQIYDPNASHNVCNYTKRVLIPFLEEKRGSNSKKYIDLGHFHNRLPNGLECLAEELGDRLAYIQIRRNRYDIARSFSLSGKESPCHDYPEEEHSHPGISYCPHSDEKHGPTYFPVNDHVWDLLSPFQMYLWLVDEMELRSHHIKETYPNVQFYETTWTTGEELTAGINDVKRSLGCSISSGGIPNKKRHVKHKPGTHNCTAFVLEDLDYRNKVGMTQEQIKIILSYPQRIGGADCMETRADMEQLLLSVGEQLDDWDIAPDPPPDDPDLDSDSPPQVNPASNDSKRSGLRQWMNEKGTKNQKLNQE